MPNPNIRDIRQRLHNTVGPTPWYWKTFPAFHSASGQRFVWTHHDDQGPLAYVVSLNLEQQPDKPRLALNTYCRPFLVPPDRLGVWCPEGRYIRFACFEPDQLKTFDLGEIAGWFKQSSDRIYAATAPIAEFEVPVKLPAGVNKIEVPTELQTVDELIVPTTCATINPDEPAMALDVFYLQAGLVEVLPQKWFTTAQYEVGPQWITRAARDPESHRIFGDGIRLGSFLLEADGCHLHEWIDKKD
jgi:hypothetical protein